MAKKPKGKPYDFTQRETQDEADALVRAVAREMKDTVPDIYWSIRSEEDQKDLGIDMECELVDRLTRKTIILFKLQNKGSKTALVPLTTTENKGLISFSLKVDKAKYYRQQINMAVMFMVCDLEKKVVYWHPVQLDDAIDNRVKESEKAGKGSIQIYIDPASHLSPHTVERFLKEVKESHEEQFIRFNEHLKHRLFEDSEEIIIDKSRHLFEQLHEAIIKYFDQFSYIPPRELLKLYPFNRGKKGYTRFEGFSMITEDKKLYDLMANISDPNNITDPEIIRIDDYQEKAKRIIRQLLAQGIEYVEEFSGSRRVQLSRDLWKGVKCDCCRCCYQRGDFIGALKDANKSTGKDDIDTMFKKGYIHYKLGNYVTAFQIFEAAARKAKRNSKWIQYAVALFNIKNLRTLVQFYAYDHPGQQQALRKIKEMNIEKALSAIRYKKYFGGELVKWMMEEKFYSQYFINVANTVQEIEKQYYAQLAGGWSTRQTGRQLLSELYQLVSFVNYNFIIFDRYSDFDHLFDFATKGYIASYAMLDTGAAGLQHFNYIMMAQLIGYAKPDTIITYYNRFTPRSFQFQPVQSPSLLVRTLRSFLDNYRQHDKLRALLEPGNTDSFRLLGEMISSGLALVALSDVAGSEIDELIATIVETDKAHGILYMESIKYFRYLLSMKGKDISLPTWKRILAETLERPLFQDLQLVDVIVDEISKHFPEYVMSEEQVKRIVAGLDGKRDEQQRPHAELLVYYWFVAGTDGKKIIQEKILSLLSKHFDPSLYYSASIFKIIDYKPHLKEMIAFARPDENRRSFDTLFNPRGDVFSRPIDMLVNLLFQFDEKLEGKDLQDFKTFSPYYAWLFDLEGFDYSSFDPKWLLNHPTRFYMDKFKKIPAIKQAIITYLKAKQNPALTKLFLNHFTE